MAGTLIDYKVLHKSKLDLAFSGGDPLILLIGKIVLKNGTDNFALDLTADIPTVLSVYFNPTGGYVMGYDIANKLFVVYAQTVTPAAKDPLGAVTGKDLGALDIPFIAVGY